MEEIKLMIVGIALLNTQVACQTHQPAVGNACGNGILSFGWNATQANHYTKLEFPWFDGLRLNEWLYKMDQAFEIDDTSEADKVKLVITDLDGKALH